jgi:hypothetical protein
MNSIILGLFKVSFISGYVLGPGHTKIIAVTRQLTISWKEVS